MNSNKPQYIQQNAQGNGIPFTFTQQPTYAPPSFVKQFPNVPSNGIQITFPIKTLPQQMMQKQTISTHLVNSVPTQIIHRNNMISPIISQQQVHRTIQHHQTEAPRQQNYVGQIIPPSTNNFINLQKTQINSIQQSSTNMLNKKLQHSVTLPIFKISLPSQQQPQQLISQQKIIQTFPSSSSSLSILESQSSLLSSNISEKIRPSSQQNISTQNLSSSQFQNQHSTRPLSARDISYAEYSPSTTHHSSQIPTQKLEKWQKFQVFLYQNQRQSSVPSETKSIPSSSIKKKTQQQQQLSQIRFLPEEYFPSNEVKPFLKETVPNTVKEKNVQKQQKQSTKQISNPIIKNNKKEKLKIIPSSKGKQQLIPQNHKMKVELNQKQIQEQLQLKVEKQNYIFQQTLDDFDNLSNQDFYSLSNQPGGSKSRQTSMIPESYIFRSIEGYEEQEIQQNNQEQSVEINEEDEDGQVFNSNSINKVQQSENIIQQLDGFSSKKQIQTQYEHPKSCSKKKSQLKNQKETQDEHSKSFSTQEFQIPKQKLQQQELEQQQQQESQQFQLQEQEQYQQYELEQYQQQDQLQQQEQKLEQEQQFDELEQEQQDQIAKQEQQDQQEQLEQQQQQDKQEYGQSEQQDQQPNQEQQVQQKQQEQLEQFQQQQKNEQQQQEQKQQEQLLFQQQKKQKQEQQQQSSQKQQEQEQFLLESNISKEQIFQQSPQIQESIIKEVQDDKKQTLEKERCEEQKIQQQEEHSQTDIQFDNQIKQNASNKSEKQENQILTGQCNEEQILHSDEMVIIKQNQDEINDNNLTLIDNENSSLQIFQSPFILPSNHENNQEKQDGKDDEQSQCQDQQENLNSRTEQICFQEQLLFQLDLKIQQNENIFTQQSLLKLSKNKELPLHKELLEIKSHSIDHANILQSPQSSQTVKVQQQIINLSEPKIEDKQQSEFQSAIQNQREQENMTRALQEETLNSNSELTTNQQSTPPTIQSIVSKEKQLLEIINEEENTFLSEQSLIVNSNNNLNNSYILISQVSLNPQSPNEKEKLNHHHHEQNSQNNQIILDGLDGSLITSVNVITSSNLQDIILSENDSPEKVRKQNLIISSQENSVNENKESSVNENKENSYQIPYFSRDSTQIQEQQFINQDSPNYEQILENRGQLFCKNEEIKKSNEQTFLEEQELDQSLVNSIEDDQQNQQRCDSNNDKLNENIIPENKNENNEDNILKQKENNSLMQQLRQLNQNCQEQETLVNDQILLEQLLIPSQNLKKSALSEQQSMKINNIFSIQEDNSFTQEDDILNEQQPRENNFKEDQNNDPPSKEMESDIQKNQFEEVQKEQILQDEQIKQESLQNNSIKSNKEDNFFEDHLKSSQSTQNKQIMTKNNEINLDEQNWYQPNNSSKHQFQNENEIKTQEILKDENKLYEEENHKFFTAKAEEQQKQENEEQNQQQEEKIENNSFKNEKRKQQEDQEAQQNNDLTIEMLNNSNQQILIQNKQIDAEVQHFNNHNQQNEDLFVEVNNSSNQQIEEQQEREEKEEGQQESEIQQNNNNNTQQNDDTVDEVFSSGILMQKQNEQFEEIEVEGKQQVDILDNNDEELQNNSNNKIKEDPYLHVTDNIALLEDKEQEAKSQNLSINEDEDIQGTLRQEIQNQQVNQLGTIEMIQFQKEATDTLINLQQSIKKEIIKSHSKNSLEEGQNQKSDQFKNKEQSQSESQTHIQSKREEKDKNYEIDELNENLNFIIEQQTNDILKAQLNKWILKDGRKEQQYHMIEEVEYQIAEGENRQEKEKSGGLKNQDQFKEVQKENDMNEFLENEIGYVAQLQKLISKKTFQIKNQIDNLQENNYQTLIKDDLSLSIQEDNKISSKTISVTFAEIESMIDKKMVQLLEKLNKNPEKKEVGGKNNHELVSVRRKSQEEQNIRRNSQDKLHSKTNSFDLPQKRRNSQDLCKASYQEIYQSRKKGIEKEQNRRGSLQQSKRQSSLDCFEYKQKNLSTLRNNQEIILKNKSCSDLEPIIIDCQKVKVFNCIQQEHEQEQRKINNSDDRNQKIEEQQILKENYQASAVGLKQIQKREESLETNEQIQAETQNQEINLIKTKIDGSEIQQELAHHQRKSSSDEEEGIINLYSIQKNKESNPESSIEVEAFNDNQIEDVQFQQPQQQQSNHFKSSRESGSTERHVFFSEDSQGMKSEDKPKIKKYKKQLPYQFFPSVLQLQVKGKKLGEKIHLSPLSPPPSQKQQKQQGHINLKEIQPSKSPNQEKKIASQIPSALIKTPAEHKINLVKNVKTRSTVVYPFIMKKSTLHSSKNHSQCTSSSIASTTSNNNNNQSYSIQNIQKIRQKSQGQINYEKNNSYGQSLSTSIQNNKTLDQSLNQKKLKLKMQIDQIQSQISSLQQDQDSNQYSSRDQLPSHREEIKNNEITNKIYAHKNSSQVPYFSSSGLSGGYLNNFVLNSQHHDQDEEIIVKEEMKVEEKPKVFHKSEQHLPIYFDEKREGYIYQKQKKNECQIQKSRELCKSRGEYLYQYASVQREQKKEREDVWKEAEKKREQIECTFIPNLKTSKTSRSRSPENFQERQKEWLNKQQLNKLKVHEQSSTEQLRVCTFRPILYQRINTKKDSGFSQQFQSQYSKNSARKSHQAPKSQSPLSKSNGFQQGSPDTHLSTSNSQIDIHFHPKSNPKNVGKQQISLKNSDSGDEGESQAKIVQREIIEYQKAVKKLNEQKALLIYNRGKLN